MIPISPFLTAYDPSDLPGASIDPLGFERGYLHLAEKLLPGLTNVASKPRYFGVLCAGVHLSEVGPGDSPRSQYQRRVDTLLRLERLWALANVLASEAAGEEAHPVNGIRGLRYVQRKAALLHQKAQSSTTADFQVLARQSTYGVVGIYGSVAERLRFVQDRKTFSLTPDLGDRLAEAFIHETEMPTEIQAAVKQDRAVSLDRLRQWGERAHVAGGYGKTESVCLAEALHWNSTRSRVAALLEEHPRADGEEELDRLRRVLQTVRGEPEDQHIAETIDTIVAYETAYAFAQLALERLLWLCRQHASILLSNIRNDAVLGRVRRDLPGAAKRVGRVIDAGTTEDFRKDIERLDDVRTFLTELAAVCDSPDAFTEVLVRRHGDVQRGKFDRGRRKAPWIEEAGGALSLTTTRVGGLAFEATSPRHIIPHYYRTVAADALRDAGAGA